MENGLSTTLRYLARAGRARRWRLLAFRAATFVLALSVLVVAALLVVLLLPGAREWLVLALASLVLSGVGLTLAPLLLRDRPERTAAWIASRDAALGGALADAVEFGERLRTGRPVAGSPALAAAHVAQVAETAAGRDPAAHARAALRSLHAGRAAIAAACALVALVALPRARMLLLLGAAPGARDVVTHGPVELAFRYPAYLRREPRVEVGTGDIRAPVGTHVQVTIHADRPLERAQLGVQGGAPRDMQVSGTDATGELIVTGDGEYRVLLRGITGDADPEPPRHAVVAEKDAPPTVRLRAPANDTAIGPSDTLEVLYSATDDHGVSQVELLVEPEDTLAELGATATSEPTRHVLDTLDPPELSRTGTQTFTPAQLGLRDGASATLWIEARDDDQVSGPKLGASRRVRVTVRSTSQEHDALEGQQEELGEKVLATLATALVGDPDRLAGTDELLDAYTSLSQKLEDVVSSLSRVTADMSATQEDLTAATALEQMRGRLLDLLSRRNQDVALAAHLADGDGLRTGLAALHPAEVDELERDALFFDTWADRRTAIRTADAGMELLDAIRALERAVAAAEKDGASRASIESKLAEIDRLRKELAEMMGRVAAGLPNDGGRARAQDRALSAMEALMKQAREALARGDREALARAAAELESAGASLADLVADLAAQGGAGDPELAQAVQELRRELAKVRAQQADLRDRTNALRDQAREQVSPEDRQRAEALFAELRRLADEAVAAEAAGETGIGNTPLVKDFFDHVEERSRLQLRLSELGRRAEQEGDHEELQRVRARLHELLLDRLAGTHDVISLMFLSQSARESLGRLRQTLADRDLGAARPAARWSLNMLEQLVDDLSHGPSPDLVPRAVDFRTAAARTSEILDKLDELERAVGQASESALTASQRSELEHLGAAQGELSARARALAAKLRELSADAPFLGDAIGRSVDEAGSHMDAAAGQLQAGRPSSASEEQGEAMAGLEDAAKSLVPSTRRQPGGRGRGREGNGRRASEDDVRIPDADAYRVPREFREEILEAMRESPSPPGLEEQVREYYRRLVE